MEYTKRTMVALTVILMALTGLVPSTTAAPTTDCESAIQAVITALSQVNADPTLTEALEDVQEKCPRDFDPCGNNALQDTVVCGGSVDPCANDPDACTVPDVCTINAFQDVPVLCGGSIENPCEEDPDACTVPDVCTRPQVSNTPVCGGPVPDPCEDDPQTCDVPNPCADGCGAPCTHGETCPMDTAPMAECLDGLDTCCEKTEETGSAPWRDKANCSFSCGYGAELFINAVSKDDPSTGVVDVWGAANCGGAQATCDQNPQTCSGLSGTDIAMYTDNEGSCWADTDDWWSSRTTVTCVASLPGLPSCNMGETPDVEDLQRCGKGYTCEEYLTGAEGHETGVTACWHDDAPNTYIVCVYNNSGQPTCRTVTLPEAPLAFASFAPPDVATVLSATSGIVQSFVYMEIGGGEPATGGGCNQSGCFIIEPTCYDRPEGPLCYIGQITQA